MWRESTWSIRRVRRRTWREGRLAVRLERRAQRHEAGRAKALGLQSRQQAAKQRDVAGGRAHAGEHTPDGRRRAPRDDGDGGDRCDEVPAEQRLHGRAQRERAAGREHVGDARRQGQRPAAGADPGQPPRGRGRECGRCRRPGSERLGIDRGPRLVADDREVLPEVELSSQLGDRLLPPGHDLRRGRPQQPGRQRRPAAVRPGDGETLEQGALAEQIEVRRVQVGRIRKVLPRIAGAHPGVAEARRPAVVEGDGPLEAGAFRLDAVEPHAEPEQHRQRGRDPPGRVARAADRPRPECPGDSEAGEAPQPDRAVTAVRGGVRRLPVGAAPGVGALRVGQVPGHDEPACSTRTVTTSVSWYCWWRTEEA